MASLKEINDKTLSIKNTQKITKAMEMVAASKVLKTQEKMQKGRPYSEKLIQVVQHVACSNPEYKHSYLVPRTEIKNVGIIVVSTDRGLCGGLNSNLFREILKFMQSKQQQNISCKLGLIGRKSESFFKKFAGDVLGITTHIGDTPELQDIIGAINIMLEAYDNNQIDALYLSYNQFISTMTQKPYIQQLLPLPIDKSLNIKKKYPWDYIYEPDAKELLDSLLQRYIELQVYHGIIENIACEQAAKMVAMKSASDNAGDLIKQFQLDYNKARQAAITQELAEIVGGAAAV